ncbi:MAG TPA: tRNA preQ1(34) S-adenosylmethionine ribosyltransferase-isomerase QueA, partial [Chitinophagales bacterium]|nr:tRNA preQ1(34) S-adenosylmethionine ribosyltransferase-isomerase QueA [Chitinophagales bacterium]
MKLSDFNFELPKELIAQYPAENRHESRLMVVHRDTGKIEHRIFKDVLEYFDDGDVMIVNNTKVFPARLFGRKEKTGAKIEVFMLRDLSVRPGERLWDVLVEPARKIRVGNKLYFGDDDELVAEVVDNTTSRGRTVRFLYDGDDDGFREILAKLGHTPLPKYIKRPAEDFDRERYQTVYANNEGAVAAPTAGLHFSRELMKRLEIKGVEFAELTLHVGLGTFRSIEVEDLSKHKMDAEYYHIPERAAELVNKAKEHADVVVASVFVNPTQFGPNEDFARYPRDIEGDTRKLASAGADAVFVPEVATMYPPGEQTRVSVGALADHLCGPFRP